MRQFKIFVFTTFFIFLITGCATTGTGTKGENSASPVLERVIQSGELVVGTTGNMPPPRAWVGRNSSD